MKNGAHSFINRFIKKLLVFFQNEVKSSIEHMFHASDEKIITNTDTFTHSSYKKESHFLTLIVVIEITSNEAHN